jgi:hypothetical protein
MQICHIMLSKPSQVAESDMQIESLYPCTILYHAKRYCTSCFGTAISFIEKAFHSFTLCYPISYSPAFKIGLLNSALCVRSCFALVPETTTTRLGNVHVQSRQTPHKWKPPDGVRQRVWTIIIRKTADDRTVMSA